MLDQLGSCNPFLGYGADVGLFWLNICWQQRIIFDILMYRQAVKIQLAGNKNLLNYLKDGLQSRDDYTLVAAYDGEEAITNYLDNLPDVLVLDLDLNRIDGFDVIKYIREQANDNDIYILALSSNDSLDWKTTALNWGANDILLKPFSQEEYWARINVADRQVRLNRQLHKAYERIANVLQMKSIWSPPCSQSCCLRRI